MLQATIPSGDVIELANIWGAVAPQPPLVPMPMISKFSLLGQPNVLADLCLVSLFSGVVESFCHFDELVHRLEAAKCLEHEFPR